MLSPSQSAPAAEVEQAIARLLRSTVLGRRGSQKRLLIWLVSHANDPDSSAFREEAIAHHVWGRDSAFTPLEDSIVRKAAARLRISLETYYAGEGRFETTRIVIPAGGYRPQFFAAQIAATPASHQRLLLLPTRSTAPQCEPALSAMIDDEFRHALSVAGRHQLVSPALASRLQLRTGDWREHFRRTGAPLIVEPAVHAAGGNLLRLQVQCLWGPDARCLWYRHVALRTTDPALVVRAFTRRVAPEIVTLGSGGAEAQRRG